jgi:hypothetical protein
MSPLSLLIDHSQLLNRVQTLYSFAPDAEKSTVDHEDGAIAKAVEQHDERATQIKGLVVGTLLFVPFLITYFVASASR